MSFKALVQTDFMRNLVRLQVISEGPQGHISALLENGMWREVPPHTVLPTEAGIDLHPEALPAIAEAIAQHLGKNLPSVAEVAVLREWLALEQRRVNSLLDARVEIERVEANKP